MGISCLYLLPDNGGIPAVVTDSRFHLAARRSIQSHCARGFSPVPALCCAVMTLTRPRQSFFDSISTYYKEVVKKGQA